MLLGVGSEDRHLTEPEIRALLEAGVAQIEAAGKRVLVIIPDGTRSGPLRSVFACWWSCWAAWPLASTSWWPSAPTRR